MKFTCTKCGNCCRGAPGFFVRLSEKDKSNIVPHYPKLNIVNDCIRLDDYGGKCPFLKKDNTCLIHAIKPEQCASFPLGWPIESYMVLEDIHRCPGVQIEEKDLVGLQQDKTIAEVLSQHQWVAPKKNEKARYVGLQKQKKKLVEEGKKLLQKKENISKQIKNITKGITMKKSEFHQIVGALLVHGEKALAKTFKNSILSSFEEVNKIKIKIRRQSDLLKKAREKNDNDAVEYHREIIQKAQKELKQTVDRIKKSQERKKNIKIHKDKLKTDPTYKEITDMGFDKEYFEKNVKGKSDSDIEKWYKQPKIHDPTATKWKAEENGISVDDQIKNDIEKIIKIKNKLGK